MNMIAFNEAIVMVCRRLGYDAERARDALFVAMKYGEITTSTGEVFHTGANEISILTGLSPIREQDIPAADVERFIAKRASLISGQYDNRQKQEVQVGTLVTKATSDTGKGDEEAPDDGQAEAMVKQATDAAKAESADAALFDPVTPAALEKMFPNDGKWAKWHAKAKEKGLDIARDGVGKYNPFRAAMWWLDKQSPKGWDIARCRRTLAKNFPARSRGSESQFTGGEIE
jgi:hypothetical protein